MTASGTSDTYHLGIDLGTTYVAAGILRRGRPEIVTLGDRAPVVPSVLYFKDDGEVLHGEAATRRSLSDPTRVAREFKRRVGDATPMVVGRTPYSAEVLLAKLLAFAHRSVVERQGGRPGSIVVTHPANWGSYKIDVLQQAVRMADIGAVSTLTEPVAAAIHYAATERLDPGGTVAVYDLGGGTFDAAVLRRTGGDSPGGADATAVGFEVLGDVEGIERLGGIDFDEAVFHHAIRWCDTAVGELDPDDPAVIQALARLRHECIEAKEALSTDTDVSIPILLPNLQTEVRLTRAEFEAMIRPLLQQTVDALHRAIRSSGVQVEMLDAILLVGGSSRIPLIAEMVAAELGRPIAVDQHPKHTVALGAAIAAGRAAGAEVPQPAAGAPPIAAAGAGRAVLRAPAVASPGESQLVKLSPVPAVAAAVPVVAAGAAAGVEPRPAISVPVVSAPAPIPAPIPASAPIPAPAQDLGALARPVAFAAAPRVDESAGRRATAAPMFSHTDVLAGSPRSTGGLAWPALVAAFVVIVGLIGAAVLMLNDGDGAGDGAVLAGDGSGAAASDGAAGETSDATLAAGASPSAAGQGADPGGDANGATTEATQATEATVSADTSTTTGLTTSATDETTTTAPTDAPRSASISGIELDGSAYVVSYSTTFDPVISGDPATHHLHFFFDTVGAENAGVPEAGPWILYDGPSPFRGYGPGDRPEGATRLCVTVAHHDHTLDDPSTFDCAALPE